MSSHDDHSDCGHDHSKDHSHEHGEDCGHDHSADKPQPGMMFANAMINMANEALQNNVPPQELANGMRHAAANFTAFAAYQPDGNADPAVYVEEFRGFLDYYMDRHKPAAPMPGLQDIINKAKSEL